MQKRASRKKLEVPWGRVIFGGLWLTVGSALIAMLLDVIQLPWWSILLLISALGVSIALGVMSQRCGFFARPLNRITGQPHRLCLTFDDGPDPLITPQVLELLASHGQRGTFFVIGDRVQRYPELTQQIVAEGHELANHSSFHHWHMALWSPARLTADLQYASRLIEETSGTRPCFFRPPAAVLSPAIETASRRAGLRLVGYSLRTGDGSPWISAERVRQRWHKGLASGAIIVLHDVLVGNQPPVSLAILPELLAEMDRRSLKSVPLRELYF